MRIWRDAVRCEGTDALSFLQGQLSQDVEAIAVGDTAWSLILQPQGKLDAFVRVMRTAADAVVVDVDQGFGDAVATRLDRFLLRVKATVTALGTFPCDIDESADPAAPLAAFGTLDLGAAAAHPNPDHDAWDALRVRRGIPAMGAELTTDTIPEEAGLVDVSVSFTKGCYTGQELVARIDSRGRNVPRRLRRIDAGVPLEAGAEIALDGKAVGRVTTAAGGAGLGYVGRAVDAPAVVEVRGGVARIEALPPLR